MSLFNSFWGLASNLAQLMCSWISFATLVALFQKRCCLLYSALCGLDGARRIHGSPLPLERRLKKSTQWRSSLFSPTPATAHRTRLLTLSIHWWRGSSQDMPALNCFINKLV